MSFSKIWRNRDISDQLIHALDGKDRFAARKLIVAMMDERGFLEKVEDHTPYGPAR